MPDQLSALVPKKKRNRAFLIPEKGVGTVLLARVYADHPLLRRVSAHLDVQLQMI